MRGVAAVVWLLAVTIPSLARASDVDPAEVWRPMFHYLGTWKGTRPGADGPIKLTRVYTSASSNHYLEITETGRDRSRSEVRGMMSFDRPRQTLILRLYALDGSASDLVLDPSSTTAGQLVFASLDTSSSRTRIVYQRTGPKNFVERIEQSSGGEPYALVTETTFVRKD